MNYQTANLISKFWKESQNYALSGNMMVYVNHLHDLSNQWLVVQKNSTIVKELEKTIYELVVKISEYRYMETDLVLVFSDLVVSFIDQQMKDEQKINELEIIFNNMDLSYNLQKHLMGLKIES